MKLVIILFFAALLAVSFFTASLAVRRVKAEAVQLKEEINGAESYISEMESDTKSRIDELAEVLAELAADVREIHNAVDADDSAEKEAERRLQDGINSILNYSSQRNNDDK